MKILSYCTTCAIVLSIQLGACNLYNPEAPKTELPTYDHHLSYIPFDNHLDDPTFTMCDSTTIRSGRNRLQYAQGSEQLIQTIHDRYQYKPEYESYSGYIVIRFLMNCENRPGRYRALTLKEDFTTQRSQTDIAEHSMEIIKSLNSWIKSDSYGDEAEYLKFINLKFINGQLQHVLL